MKCYNLHPLSLKIHYPRSAQTQSASCIHPFFQAHSIRPWKLRMCGHSSLCSGSSWPTTWQGLDLSHTSPWHPVSGLKLEPDLPSVHPALLLEMTNPHSQKHSILASLTELPAPHPSWTTGLWILVTTLGTPLTISPFLLLRAAFPTSNHHRSGFSDFH
jgi:hypothetical protein